MAFLDTSALVDLGKGNQRAAEAVLRAKDESPLKTSTVTVFELASGRPGGLDEKRKKLVASTLVVAFTQEHAEKAGIIHRQLKDGGQEINTLDTMIAGAALCENEPLITANAKHFQRVEGLRLITY